MLYVFPTAHNCATWSSHLVLLDLITLILFYKLWISFFCMFPLFCWFASRSSTRGWLYKLSSLWHANKGTTHAIQNMGDHVKISSVMWPKVRISFCRFSGTVTEDPYWALTDDYEAMFLFHHDSGSNMRCEGRWMWADIKSRRSYYSRWDSNSVPSINNIAYTNSTRFIQVMLCLTVISVRLFFVTNRLLLVSMFSEWKEMSFNDKPCHF